MAIGIDEIALLRMVKLGFSVKTIAGIYDCHISTITNRLNALGVSAMDGRRNFIEDVFYGLEEDEQLWLIESLDYYENIKELFKEMIKNAHQRHSAGE